MSDQQSHQTQGQKFDVDGVRELIKASREALAALCAYSSSLDSETKINLQMALRKLERNNIDANSRVISTAPALLGAAKEAVDLLVKGDTDSALASLSFAIGKAEDRA